MAGGASYKVLWAALRHYPNPGTDAHLNDWIVLESFFRLVINARITSSRQPVRLRDGNVIS